ncbi:phospholipase D [Arthrobacter sp. Hiyo4]|nr:phospholipase D [Arthrobacter sp. Hiyo4]
MAGAMVSGTAASGFSASQGGVFCHGVASGDPMADSVLLWTRVTPAPAALPGTGLGPDVSVGWEIAADAGFKKIVARGTAATGAARDHTVKVIAGRLAAATNYWYRFKLGQAVSPAGRTRTAPRRVRPWTG